MPSRTRVVAFGSAGALVLAGGLCGVLIGGVTGQALAIGLIALGLGGALLLVFLEVGLSEDKVPGPRGAGPAPREAGAAAFPDLSAHRALKNRKVKRMLSRMARARQGAAHGVELAEDALHLVLEQLLLLGRVRERDR